MSPTTPTNPHPWLGSLFLLVAVLLSGVSCDRKDAALVVGGFAEGLDATSGVEIYGCDSNVEYSVQLNDFPRYCPDGGPPGRQVSLLVEQNKCGELWFCHYCH